MGASRLPLASSAKRRTGRDAAGADPSMARKSIGDRQRRERREPRLEVRRLRQATTVQAEELVDARDGVGARDRVGTALVRRARSATRCPLRFDDDLGRPRQGVGEGQRGTGRRREAKAQATLLDDVEVDGLDAEVRVAARLASRGPARPERGRPLIDAVLEEAGSAGSPQLSASTTAFTGAPSPGVKITVTCSSEASRQAGGVPKPGDVESQTVGRTRTLANAALGSHRCGDRTFGARGRDRPRTGCCRSPLVPWRRARRITNIKKRPCRG